MAGTMLPGTIVPNRLETARIPSGSCSGLPNACWFAFLLLACASALSSPERSHGIGAILSDSPKEVPLEVLRELEAEAGTAGGEPPGEARPGAAGLREMVARGDEPVPLSPGDDGDAGRSSILQGGGDVLREDAGRPQENQGPGYQNHP